MPKAGLRFHWPPARAGKRNPHDRRGIVCLAATTYATTEGGPMQSFQRMINDSRVLDRLSITALHLLRYGLLGLIASLGIFKFTSTEAAAVEPPLADSPLLSWLLSITDGPVSPRSPRPGALPRWGCSSRLWASWSPRLGAQGGPHRTLRSRCFHPQGRTSPRRCHADRGRGAPRFAHPGGAPGTRPFGCGGAAIYATHPISPKPGHTR